MPNSQCNSACHILHFSSLLYLLFHILCELLPFLLGFCFCLVCLFLSSFLQFSSVCLLTTKVLWFVAFLPTTSRHASFHMFFRLLQCSSTDLCCSSCRAWNLFCKVVWYSSVVPMSWKSWVLNFVLVLVGLLHRFSLSWSFAASRWWSDPASA